MKKILLMTFVLGVSFNASAQQDDFDVVDVDSPAQSAPAAAVEPGPVAVAVPAARAPQAVAQPVAQQSAARPTQQVARAPQSVPVAGSHFCGPTSEHNISADLDRFCNVAAPYTFTTTKDGLFYCCVRK
jgi:hypothetical protein